MIQTIKFSLDRQKGNWLKFKAFSKSESFFGGYIMISEIWLLSLNLQKLFCSPKMYIQTWSTFFMKFGLWLLPIL